MDDPTQGNVEDPVAGDLERTSRPRTPVWVWLFGIGTVVVILVFAVLLLTGGHGPGRHGSSGARDAHVALSFLVSR